MDCLVLPVWICFLSDGSLQFLVPQGELFTPLQTLFALWAEPTARISGLSVNGRPTDGISEVLMRQLSK